jgi:hypothetical protein
MASFKSGEHSTDPRRCTAHSSQTRRRCKNASILGSRICRYHGGAAAQVQKKAAQRLKELEHPALDVFQRVLEADEAHPEHRALAIRVAESVLDRTGHKQPKKLEIESGQTLDLSILSTPLVRQIAAELRQQEARDRAPMTPGPPADDRPENWSVCPIAELAKREHDKFEHYFPNCRPGCVVDSTTVADHLNEDGSQRFCRIL